MKLLVTGLMVGALCLALPSDSRADVRVGIGILVGHDHGYRGYDTQRIGFERGHRDGYHHGEKDGHHGENYNFWHDKKYRCGDAGYKRHFGPKHEYVSGYRRGYEQGYRRAFRAHWHRHSGQREWCSRRHDRDRYDDRYGRRRDWDDDDDRRLDRRH